MRLHSALAASLLTSLLGSTNAFSQVATTLPNVPPVVITKLADVKVATGCAWIDKDGNAKFANADGMNKSKDIPPGVEETGCWHGRGSDYPGFALHRIQFDKGTSTPLEYHSVDTTMYIVSGHAQNMVENVTIESNAGDAVFQNTGAWHRNHALTDDYVQIEIKHPHVTGDSLGLRDRQTYGLDLRKWPKVVGALIRNGDQPLRDLCAVTGKDGASLAPKDAKSKADACIGVKTLMPRPSGVLSEVYAKKGVKLPAIRHTDADTLFYVLSGHVQIDAGGQKTDLGPGDAVFYAVNVPFQYQVAEDTKAIEYQAFPVNGKLVEIH